MELNAFTYDDEGFICEKDPGKVYHKWADIETVFGYKRDLITTDEIYLDIFTSENSLFSISESIPGWYLFNQKLIESIASIPQGWIEDIVHPVLKTNLTLLFDKKGRTTQQAEIDLYK